MKKGSKKEWSLKRKEQYIPVIKLSSTDKDIIEWLKDSFGGNMETRKTHGNSKESYMWTMRKKQVLDFIRYIYPHTRIKTKQIQILLRFPSGKAGHPITQEVQDLREKLYKEIRKLNKRGVA